MEKDNQGALSGADGMKARTIGGNFPMRPWADGRDRLLWGVCRHISR
jgi:hypothetical protein